MYLVSWRSMYAKLVFKIHQNNQNLRRNLFARNNVDKLLNLICKNIYKNRKTTTTTKTITTTTNKQTTTTNNNIFLATYFRLAFGNVFSRWRQNWNFRRTDNFRQNFKHMFAVNALIVIIIITKWIIYTFFGALFD